jgi:hypothetical protein
MSLENAMMEQQKKLAEYKSIFFCIYVMKIIKRIQFSGANCRKGWPELLMALPVA